MEIGSLDAMGEDILFYDHKIYLQSLAYKNKKKEFMKVNKNYFLVQLLEEYLKLIKSSFNFWTATTTI
jgi:hypothetical protein